MSVPVGGAGPSVHLGLRAPGALADLLKIGNVGRFQNPLEISVFLRCCFYWKHIVRSEGEEMFFAFKVEF